MGEGWQEASREEPSLEPGESGGLEEEANENVVACWPLQLLLASVVRKVTPSECCEEAALLVEAPFDRGRMAIAARRAVTLRALLYLLPAWLPADSLCAAGDAPLSLSQLWPL